MAKLVAYAMGIGLICFGGYGIFKAFADANGPEVERRDVSTTGKIVALKATSLKHRVGVTLSTTYRMSYEFMDESGEIHQDSETITQAQYESLSRGQELPVQYHSNNPWISATRLGTYRGVNDPIFEPPTVGERIFFCSVFVLIGAAMLVCCMFFLKPDDDAVSKDPHGLAMQPY